jgi:hypothetical protein
MDFVTSRKELKKILLGGIHLITAVSRGSPRRVHQKDAYKVSHLKKHFMFGSLSI